jgi:protein-export membrane protein SecD
LRKAKIGYADLSIDGNGVRVQLRDVTTIESAREILRDAAAGMQMSIAEDGLARLELDDFTLRDWKRGILEQSIEILGIRIDQLGVTEPTIQRQGDDRILIQVPGVDPEKLKNIIGTTAKMTFQFVDSSVDPALAETGQLPPDTELLANVDTREGAVPFFVVQKRVMVSGENLVDAQAGFTDNQPVVNFRFDSVGARRFGDATTENVGQLFAIVLDGKVISAPVIREPILGGQGQISGNFTVESARDLAILLRAGALPAPLVVLEERSVGADLGADSIEAGKTAGIIGIAVIAVAMVLLYGLFGVFANIALVLNGILLLGSLSALQATLTLPGIAGIVLTLGMAVDANVLVYERIREEVRNGRSPITAIDHGYREAMNTIVDANLTTLISSLILFMLGSGPIRGFAITLSIGIVTSVFTAVMVTRLMAVIWLKGWQRRHRGALLPL